MTPESGEKLMAFKSPGPACLCFGILGSSKAATALEVSGGTQVLNKCPGTLPHLTPPPWILFAPLCL